MSAYEVPPQPARWSYQSGSMLPHSKAAPAWARYVAHPELAPPRATPRPILRDSDRTSGPWLPQNCFILQRRWPRHEKRCRGHPPDGKGCYQRLIVLKSNGVATQLAQAGADLVSRREESRFAREGLRQHRLVAERKEQNQYEVCA